MTIHAQQPSKVSDMNTLVDSAMALVGRGDGWKIDCIKGSVSAVSGKVLWQKMVKSPYNLIIHPLIKPQLANQQQQQKNYFYKKNLMKFNIFTRKIVWSKEKRIKNNIFKLCLKINFYLEIMFFLDRTRKIKKWRIWRKFFCSP